MSKVIDLNERRKKYIEEVEKKANEKYGAIKIEEDCYLIKTNTVNSSFIDEDLITKELYENEELKKAIGKLKVAEGDYINIYCKGMLPSGEKLLEVTNYSDGNSEMVKLVAKSELKDEEREILLNVIAKILEKENIKLNFYVCYNFKLLKRLFND